MKRYFGTFLALTTCLILFIYVRFLENPEKPSSEISLYSLPVDEVTTVRISEGSKSLKLEKKDKTWVLSASPTKKISTEKVQRFLLDFAALAVTPIKGFDSVGDRSVFGLTPPQRVVELMTSSGLSKTIQLGKATPVGGNVYVKLADQNDIFLMPRYKTEWTVDASQWIEPETMPKK